MVQFKKTKVHFISILKIFLIISIVVILSEVAAYIHFHKIIPQELRDSAMFVGNGVLHKKNTAKVPMIKPYLWSNYMPNPLSEKVNRYGWRYGGGLKKRPYRILCLGGSTTWSSCATSADKSYPAQLEKYLVKKGFDLDVVNGGCGYYTSAEVLGTLAFRGLYEKPDLVILHTGGNDTLPYMSPNEYRPDYTHWRTVDPYFGKLNKSDTFRLLWGNGIHSWVVRLLITIKLEPDAFKFQMIGKQLTSAHTDLLSTNDIDTRKPIGLKMNLVSLIAISKTHGAEVVTVTWNSRFDKLHHLVPELTKEPKKYAYVLARARLSVNKTNETIRQVSTALKVPVIPFDKFEPSSPSFWADQCHLTNEGCYEKAVFMGDWLIQQSGLLPARIN